MNQNDVVICMDRDGNEKRYTISELCPYPFSDEDLK